MCTLHTYTSRTVEVSLLAELEFSWHPGSTAVVVPVEFPNLEWQLLGTAPPHEWNHCNTSMHWLMLLFMCISMCRHVYVKVHVAKADGMYYVNLHSPLFVILFWSDYLASSILTYHEVIGGCERVSLLLLALDLFPRCIVALAHGNT